ncbi:hypothetical protein BH14540 [Bartonella henselae str. Houston-1]|uniref:Uncharacterized protein n=1 Tax=Bartonella henselae (strain ATCC 49882 / DSM 28221 / CCUG 30454 / Houston 1) TaxID=283166 RepID=A0A0H3LYF9_BARHE|nr:hypothetical protein BH14540 [Bartonella henselae str. Houston-1]
MQGCPFTTIGSFLSDFDQWSFIFSALHSSSIRNHSHYFADISKFLQAYFSCQNSVSTNKKTFL